jgi:hypothetical protein
MVVNFAKRLGQDGPHNMADATVFPPNVYPWSIAAVTTITILTS